MIFTDFHEKQTWKGKKMPSCFQLDSSENIIVILVTSGVFKVKKET